MDPNATLAELLEALGQAFEVLEEAQQHAENLTIWTRRHGFPPELTEDQLRQLRRYASAFGIKNPAYAIPAVALNAIIPRLAERLREVERVVS